MLAGQLIGQTMASTSCVTSCVCVFLSANRIRMLSHREHYGFHGFYLLFLFVYKYFVDTSFIFISCTNIDGDYVSCVSVCVCLMLSANRV